jgi:mycothiol synthase
VLPPTLRSELTADEVEAVDRLLARIHTTDPDRDPSPPVRPEHDDRAGASAFAASYIRRPTDHSELAAFAQAVRSGDGGWALTLLLDPDDQIDVLALGAAAVHPVLAAVGEHGGGSVRWWVRGSNSDDALLAERLGFDLTREVLQLRVALPLLLGADEEQGDDPPTAVTNDLVVRPLAEGEDERWLEVNAAAFAAHPDQGSMTQADLDARRAEPWFDPAGFLVHEGDDGQIDGFCWTKVHAEPERLGEIYVIGVHPDAAGKGLGRELVVAGITHLAEQGLTTGMLWTEHDNEVARHLYEDVLGFERHHADRLNTAEVAGTE